MEIQTNNYSKLPFVKEGAVVSKLIDRRNWSEHKLGLLDSWPDNLKQFVSLVLDSYSASFLVWSKDYFVFYNDIFYERFNAGDVGGVAAEVIPDMWSQIKSAVDEDGGGAVLICGGNKFLKTPIRGAGGSIVGWLFNQTDLSLPSKNLDVNYDIIEGIENPTIVFYGENLNVSQLNEAACELVGKDRSILGTPLRQLFISNDRLKIYGKVEAAYADKKTYRAKAVAIEMHAESKMQYFDFCFKPLYSQNGNVIGVVATAINVTYRIVERKLIVQREKDFQKLILQSPVAGCLLLGSNHEIKLINDAMLSVWDRTREEVLGSPLTEVVPFSIQNSLAEELRSVYEDGANFVENERPIRLFRKNGAIDLVYANVFCQPYRNVEGTILGILSICVDVTQQVESRLKLEHLIEQTELAKEAGQLGTFDLDLVNASLDFDRRFRKLHGIPLDIEVNHQTNFIDILHEEDRDRIVSIIEETIFNDKKNGKFDEEYRVVVGTELRWISAKGKTYVNDTRSPYRFIGTAIDITDKKLAALKEREIDEKRSRLASIVDTTDDIIISTDLDSIITSWNKAAELKFGYLAEEVVGKNIAFTLPKDKMQESLDIHNMIKLGVSVDHLDTVRLAKNGSTLDLSVTVSPIKRENGLVTGASIIARDNSVKLAAQVAILKSSEQLKVVNEVIKSISEKLDLNVILQKVTDATTSLTGAKFGAFFYNKRDSVGNVYKLYALSGVPRKHFEHLGMPRETALFHPTFTGQSVVRIADVTKDKLYGLNNPHKGMPSGHLSVRSYLAVPVVSFSGEAIGSLLFGHPDVGVFTEEHEGLVVAIAAQAAIGIDNAMLYEKVLHLNDRKDEFIGLASHELKTPLASVSGYLQLLTRQIKDDRAQQFLGKATIQVKKLISLVNDLLDVSKIEAGKLKLAYEKHDLELLVHDAIELVKTTSNSHKVVLNVEKGDYSVSLDGQRVEQVIVNLLSNAIKYSPKSDLVEMQLSCDEQNIKLSITDTGLGIPADKIDHLFSRFYRVDDVSSNISGLGIGLYLSHEIIKRHGGKIWVLSEFGVGSTFFFTVPRNQPVAS